MLFNKNIYNSLKSAHNHLKCSHKNEAFEISVMLAKLAQEQMEIEHPDFQKYKCSICGKGEHHKDMFGADPRFLTHLKLTPLYDVPKGGVYPVCSSCNKEYFYTEDEYEEKGTSPNYSNYRKTDAEKKCVNCMKILDNTDDYSEKPLDYIKIHGLSTDNIPKELLDHHEDVLLCDDCEYDVELDNTSICAICGTEEDNDSTTEVSKRAIIDSGNTPEYILDDDSEYKVCDECYHTEMYKSCDLCEETSLKIELLSALSTNGEYIEICNSCSDSSPRCTECTAIIDTDNDGYYSDDYGDYLCENHLPQNENDFDEIEEMANKALDEINPLSSSEYHIPINKSVLEKIERTFGNLLKKNKGIHLPGKISDHIIKIIDQQKIEPSEKRFLKEFLSGRSLKGDANPTTPLFTDNLASLIGYVDKVKNFKSQILDGHEISKSHKYLRDIMPLPVRVTVTEPHSGDYSSSFSVILVPNKSIMDSAKKIWGEDGKDVWELMSDNGHHDGAVAYCRIGNYDGEWLIENLQSDSDIQKIKGMVKSYAVRGYRPSILRNMVNNEEYGARVMKIANWWMRQFKGWQTFLIMLVKQLAENSNIELYITNTEHQKDKWSGIPDRSSIIYDAIPEELYDSRVKMIKKEIAEHEEIPEDQVTDEMILEFTEVFPRKEHRSSDSVENGAPELDINLWRLASDEG